MFHQIFQSSTECIPLITDKESAIRKKFQPRPYDKKKKISSKDVITGQRQLNVIIDATHRTRMQTVTRSLHFSSGVFSMPK